jgi:hypothetical protein
MRPLLDRWPAAFGIAAAAFSLAEYRDGGDPGEAILILAVAAAGYVFMALIDRPALTWPALVATSAVVVLLRLADVEPAFVFAVAALVLAAAGLISGRLERGRLHLLQAPVAAAAGLIALVALGVPDAAAAMVAAAGLAGHAAWDAYNHRTGRVVSRSFAEWCGALDAVLAVGLVALTVA